METIELKDVMNQLPVADLVKNLTGTDKNGVPSQFTMENIAAVVGEKAGILSRKIDLSIDAGSTRDLGIRFGLIQVWSEYISTEKALLYFYSETKCKEIQPAALMNNSENARLRIFKESESGNILVQNNSAIFAKVHVEVIV